MLSWFFVMCSFTAVTKKSHIKKLQYYTYKFYTPIYDIFTYSTLSLHAWYKIQKCPSNLLWKVDHFISVILFMLSCPIARVKSFWRYCTLVLTVGVSCLSLLPAQQLHLSNWELRKQKQWHINNSNRTECMVAICHFLFQLPNIGLYNNWGLSEAKPIKLIFH